MNTKKVEIRPGVFHEVPIHRGKAKLFLRRMKQLLSLISSPRFNANRDFEADIIDRYGQEKEISYYKKLALSGLYPCENETFESAFLHSKAPQKILVIGAGAGREAFALKNDQNEVYAYDNNLKMLEACEEINQSEEANIRVIKDEFILKETSFDLIFITFALPNHLLEKEERVLFYQKWKEQLKPDGKMILSAFFREVEFPNRFYWSHLILKLRWFAYKQTPRGLTAVSNLGFHNDDLNLIPIYYFQSCEEFYSELKEAGLEAREVPISSQASMENECYFVAH